MLSQVVLRDPTQQCWFLYERPLAVLATDVHAEVATMLAKVEQRVERERLYAAGFVCYGAAAGFDQALPEQTADSLPLLCFALFEQRTRVDALAELTAQPPDPAYEALNWQLMLAQQAYHQGVNTLHEHISRGDTYQVNYTARLCARGHLDLAMFTRIAGDAPYGAFLDGNGFTIVSASPELFFEMHNGHLRSRPMKGTAPRGLDSKRDMAAAAWLQQSLKNRAENLMITDMVRNDLGRIAVPGSVQVPALFEVEQYPTVWQMTSTVEAATDVDTVAAFRALFPGASITGAPKRAAMQFINELETAPREIYTGAIGVMEPQGLRRFSIAIRTAWTDKRSNMSFYAAGGGIVWDSDATEEYAELLAKTQVLHSQPQHFALLETMRWQKNSGVYLRGQHLTRLASSARYFQFEFCAERIEQQLDKLLAGLPDHHQALKIRLLLNADGGCEIHTSELPVEQPSPQLLMFASTPVDNANVFLYHKTTQRTVYEQAVTEVPPGVEPLLLNTQGMVTETSIANVVYQLAGELYTPPVKDGLLPGTLREELLQQGVIKERSLHVGETDKVEAWHLINALRGWRSATLEGEENHVQDLLLS